MAAKIVVVGSLMADITGYSSRLPVAGESVLGELLRTSPGGKGSNQTIAAHMAGGEALLVGCVGNDSQANILTDFYDVRKISTRCIRRVPESFTGTAMIEVNTQTAQNRILAIPGANNCVNGEDVLKAEADIANCDIVLTQLEIPDEPIILAARLAKKYGKVFMLNPAPYREFSDELLAMVDYITPNETEAEYITGVHIDTVEDASRAAAVMHGMGIKNVVITLGSKGAYFSGSGKSVFSPSIKVKAVETTGAGDSFNGALAVAIGEGMEIEEALHFANTAAGISVTRYGTAQSMASRDEIKEMM